MSINFKNKDKEALLSLLTLGLRLKRYTIETLTSTLEGSEWLTNGSLCFGLGPLLCQFGWSHQGPKPVSASPLGAARTSGGLCRAGTQLSLLMDSEPILKALPSTCTFSEFRSHICFKSSRYGKWHLFLDNQIIISVIRKEHLVPSLSLMGRPWSSCFISLGLSWPVWKRNMTERDKLDDFPRKLL